MIPKKVLTTFLACSVLLLAGHAEAAIFPDVPQGHLYQEPIEALAQAQVINGNPDGNFSPDRMVNRAEMLKMLYKATGKQPDAASKSCFTDVGAGAWYESFVCDAAAHHFVEGYSSDGTFRPADPVNRVEALKMVLQVFGIGIADVSEEQQQIVKFVDVSTTAWYTKYLYTAYLKQILPIAGQEPGRFYPDWPLLRGEAAAIIYNALHADLREQRSSATSSVPASASSQGTTVSSVSSSVASSGNTEAAVSFPFSVSGKFTQKKSFSYRFTLANPVMALTEVKLQAGQPGQVSCRLYLMQDDGFSYEYYLGFQQGSSCTLKTALSAGNYQLQIQPTSADTTFTVSAKTTTGDGNDGFREAQTLLRTVARTGTFVSGDYQDWFTFTVDKETEMEVTASDSTQLTCVVYPLEGVELAGFVGPECNQHYLYSRGTYVVGVGRKFPSDAQQTYTVVVQ